MHSQRQKSISKSIKRILLIRIQKIGDVLLTTPAVHSLRKQFPRAHITYLTGKTPKEALLNNPDIDEILVYVPGIFQKIIRRKSYDLAINFDDVRESKMACFLSRAKYRIGLTGRRATAIKNMEIYNILPARLTAGYSVLDCFLNLIRSLGLKAYARKTRVYLTESEKKFARRYLKRHGLEDCNIAGIHPGGRDEEELWQAVNFARLADKLCAKCGFKVLIFQGQGEKTVVRKVYSNIREKDKVFIAPELPFRQYASLVDICNVFITHDRGPMHISAGLGVKTVGIFTSPVAQSWFPYKKEKGYAYLQKGDIKDIKVQEVLGAVRSFYPTGKRRCIGK